MIYAKISSPTMEGGGYCLDFYSSLSCTVGAAGSYYEDSTIGMQKEYWDYVEKEFGKTLDPGEGCPEQEKDVYLSFLASKGFIPISELFFYKP